MRRHYEEDPFDLQLFADDDGDEVTEGEEVDGGGTDDAGADETEAQETITETIGSVEYVKDSEGNYCLDNGEGRLFAVLDHKRVPFRDRLGEAEKTHGQERDDWQKRMSETETFYKDEMSRSRPASASQPEMTEEECYQRYGVSLEHRRNQVEDARAEFEGKFDALEAENEKDTAWNTVHRELEGLKADSNYTQFLEDEDFMVALNKRMMEIKVSDAVAGGTVRSLVNELKGENFEKYASKFEARGTRKANERREMVGAITPPASTTGARRPGGGPAITEEVKSFAKMMNMTEKTVAKMFAKREKTNAERLGGKQDDRKQSGR